LKIRKKGSASICSKVTSQVENTDGEFDAKKKA